MTTGRFLFAGLLALVLAIGASSTASARGGYSFGFAALVWRAYPDYQVVAPATVLVTPTEIPGSLTPAFPIVAARIIAQ